MALVTVRDGLTLDGDAAASWLRMEFRRGSQLDVNSSYRDYDEQMRAYRAYQAYLTYKRGGAFAPWAPLALHPNDSWHCLGLAVDTDDDWWVRANPEFGWRFVVASESWHAQYYASLDQFRGSPVPSSSASVPFPGAAPIQTGVADMLIFNGVSNPDQFYIAVYDGRNFKVRPTFGLESKLLRNAVPQVPRAQFLDDEVVDLAAQGGYRFDVERGVGVDADGREYVF